MSNDILGTVTLERLQKAAERFPEDVTYNSMLLDRFLSQQMKVLACTGSVDTFGLIIALKLFGIFFAGPDELQFENVAQIDAETHTLTWYKNIHDGLNNVGRVYRIISPGGVSVKEVYFEKEKPRNRKPFSELPKELQNKIRQWHPDKTY